MTDVPLIRRLPTPTLLNLADRIETRIDATSGQEQLRAAGRSADIGNELEARLPDLRAELRVWYRNADDDRTWVQVARDVAAVTA
jgi:hypothetical protein